MLDIILSQYFSLISAFFVLILSIIVLQKNYDLLLNRLFFLITIILHIWLLGSYMMFGSLDEPLIIYWDRFFYAALVFLPALQYHFSLAVTYFSLSRKRLLFLAYGLSFLFFILSQTNYFVNEVFYYTWGLHTKAQIFHHFFVIYFIIYTCLFLKNLLKRYKKEKRKLEKNRIYFYIFGFLVLNILGGSTFLPAYSIAFPPISILAPILFSFIITYSIVYFNLMNIKLTMRRYFVNFLAFSASIVPAYLILFLIDDRHPYYTFLTSILVLALALAFFIYIKEFFYKISNKYFFSTLYDFNDLVYKISLLLHSSFDENKIFKSLLKLLTKSFHSQSGAIISYRVKDKEIIVHCKKNLTKLKSQTFDLDESNLKKFFNSSQPWLIDDLSKKMANHNCPLLGVLLNFGIEVVVPIKSIDKKVYYFMIFGPTISKEKYNQRDLKVLELVSFELSLTLDNISLYENIKDFNLRLKIEIDKATATLRAQNKKLIQLDRAKNEFISIASHQLRTPLTGIRWATGSLMKNSNKSFAQEDLDLIKQVNKSNLTLIRLLNDLLDVSRIQLGEKYTINKERFKVKEALNDALAENEYLIQEKMILIKDKLPSALLIKADRAKIKQVFQNLISNACKYSKANGEIEISVKETDRRYIFYIKDKGIGVPKKDQSRLFIKFFRASNAHLQSVEGTGLGLYIAKEIVKAHQGDLLFKENKPFGSIFYFSLKK
jgi:signal transduction histidine kinase